jgi:hypothetical protein
MTELGFWVEKTAPYNRLMIKTLRITSIVAAVAAGILFVFPVIFGVRSDQEAEQFLNSPGVIELFKKAQGSTEKTGQSQSSPLVTQAQAFAKYLKPEVKAPVVAPGPQRSIPRPVAPVSAKFPLLATVVHESNPELSIALINEPGAGFRWVRQGSEVMHLIIEQVKEGLIVCRDGQKTSEILVEPRPTQTSLLQGESSVSASSSAQTSTVAGAQAGPKAVSGPAGKASGPIASRTPPAGPPRPQGRMSEEDRAALEALGDKLHSLMKGGKSGKTGPPPDSEEMAAMMDALISDLKATRLSAEEAKKLGDLGKKLENVRQDPNRARDGKITNGGTSSIRIPPRRAK